jgi:hypothetical protein
MVVVTDPAKHEIVASVNGQPVMSISFDGGGPIVDLASSEAPGPTPAFSVKDETASTPRPTLCLGLTG